MRFKQRLKVIQSLEDTAKRSVVWVPAGLGGGWAGAGPGGSGALSTEQGGCRAPPHPLSYTALVLTSW